MTFQDCPDYGNGIRLVGTTLMDEEQFRTEQWHVDRNEWRPTLAGLIRYGRLIGDRRNQRIAEARARRETEDEFTEYVESLDDAKAKYGR